LLWNIIGGEKFQKVKKENLALFLMSVLGIDLEISTS
jgi:hypothetical protein